MSACSVKATSTPDEVPPPAPVKKEGIPGPAVEGAWTSNCEYLYSQTYRRIGIKFTSDVFERIESRFSDSLCKISVSEKITKGLFYFTENENSEYYTIEYKEDLGNGWSSLTNEKVYKDTLNNLLYLSNFRMGFDVKKENMMPLKAIN